MLVCGGIALLGFPLDAFWHALFGEDVTLWGPTHLFMIGGAGVSTLGLWMVMRQGFELGRPRKVARRGHLRVAGALIIGLSTFQAEFDFGVPQFQLLYQPVLIAFAAGVALVCARSILGRWGAFQALGMFFVIRIALALFVGQIAGLHDAALPALHRRGGRRRGRRVRRAALAAALRAAQRAGHRDRRPRGRVGLEPRLDAPSVARVDARARGRPVPGRRAGRQRPRRAPEPEPRDARERARGPAGDRAARGRAGGRRRARGALLPAAAHRRRRHACADRPDARRRRARQRRRHARSAHRGARQPVVRDPLLAGADARPAAPAHRAAPGRRRAATSPSAPCR